MKDTGKNARAYCNVAVGVVRVEGQMSRIVVLITESSWRDCCAHTGWASMESESAGSRESPVIFDSST